MAGTKKQLKIGSANTSEVSPEIEDELTFPTSKIRDTNTGILILSASTSFRLRPDGDTSIVGQMVLNSDRTASYDGHMNFTESPIEPNHAVNKKYADKKLSKTDEIQNLEVVTQAEYDAITTKSATTIYFIKA